LEQASPLIAASFVAEIEESVAKILVNPNIWRVVDPPDIRRYLIRRFPYAVYYRWESEHKRVAIYAVMHLRREPGYWKRRIT
jgi:plasmid stabilization system protein ParE